MNDLDQDRLDTLLRRAPGPIADDGFTARVLAALPQTRQPWYASRGFVLVAATVLGSLAVVLIPGVFEYTADSLISLSFALAALPQLG